jgi:uncharacterized membrane protein YjgN (DUF898 family)
MHQPVQALPSEPPHAVVFHGSRGRFWKLVARGALLEFVTLGFYRFWLTTDIRKHLWSNTSVGGDPAEYTGRARELLVGFLIAVTILIPFYLAYFLLGLEAERLQAFASVPLIFAFLVFGQFAVYRARRYRVTRTVWRGLRFSMTGSALAYCWRASLWSLLVALTLGIAYPWRQAALERFKMRHTSYGTLEGRFEGRPRQLLGQIWWMLLLAPFALVLFVPAPFLYAAFRAAEWRWWISGIRLGEVAFHSDLTRKALFGIYWKVVGWLTLIFAAVGALYAGFIAAAVLRGGQETSEVEILAAAQSPAILVGIALSYLIAGVAAGAIIRVYLSRDVWVRIAATTSVLNISAAEDVSGQGSLADPLGEGLIDGFDMGGL